MIVESKTASKCTYFVERCDVLEQNMHYFWNRHSKISKKQVLDFIEQI